MQRFWTTTLSLSSVGQNHFLISFAFCSRCCPFSFNPFPYYLLWFLHGIHVRFWCCFFTVQMSALLGLGKYFGCCIQFCFITVHKMTECWSSHGSLVDAASLDTTFATQHQSRPWRCTPLQNALQVLSVKHQFRQWQEKHTSYHNFWIVQWCSVSE